MKDEKNITPVTRQSWINPSATNQSVDNSLKAQVDENTREISELRNEINELKNEISNNTVQTIPEVTKAEIKEEVEVPFNSPFSEAIDETPSIPAEVEKKQVQDILETVKEEVKEAPILEQDLPPIDAPLIDENKEKISVVVNRYNNDIMASTTGKGAKFIPLTDSEHAKLLSGKINE